MFAAAEDALTSGPWSVTTKDFVPAGATSREYVHIAEYAWPDERDPSMPWVLRDGWVNPAAAGLASDGRSLARLGDAVGDLSTAHGLSDDPRFTHRIATLLRTWFTDPVTGMVPSLRHAVHVPGCTEPMDWGLARMHPLLQVLDSLELLEATGAVPEEMPDLRDWCEQFLEWLTGSDLYRAELARGNNHATQAIALALGLAVFVRDEELAAVTAERAAEVVEAQVLPDGTQPAELARPRSYHYCAFNLLAMLRVAELAWCCGIDLFRAEDAPRRALDALLPVLVDPSRWPTRGPEPTDVGRHGDLLVRALATWPGQQRILLALAESRITPPPAHRVWLDMGIDPSLGGRAAA